MVKTDSYAELLTDALREAIAIKEGKAEPARVSRVRISAAHARVPPPPEYDPRRIREIRGSLSVSQSVFAAMLNVSSSTVSAWEQGARQPGGPTLRLLELAEENPEVFLTRVQPGRVA